VLTPEDAEKIQLKALANVIRKVQAGGTLTGREQAMLEQASRGTSGAVESAFAKTQEELAKRLGISRKTITNHQRDEGAPATRADGRYDVAAWSKFLREKGITDESGDEEGPKPKVNWKDELQRLKCVELEQKLEVDRRNLVPIGEALDSFSRTTSAFRQSLNQLPGRIAHAAEGLDYDEIVAVCESEINAILRPLSEAKFLEDPPEEILGELAEEDPEVTDHGTELESPAVPIQEDANTAPSKRRPRTKGKKKNGKKAKVRNTRKA